MEMFYEEVATGENGAQTLPEKVIKQRPYSVSLDDVFRVVKLHAANPAMHHVIDKFIELYVITLQWDWFAQYQSWLERKAQAEVLPEIDLDADIMPLVFEPFAEPAPVRPDMLSIEQYRSMLVIDGLRIDEYLFRTVRTNAVRAITVEVDGLVFDGDEDSQRRMLAAIHASEDAGITQTIWRLADNSQIAVNVEQLRAAHAAAIIEQGKLWTKT